MQRTRMQSSSEPANLVVQEGWLRDTRERLERRLSVRHGKDEAADLAAEVVTRCLAHPSAEGRPDAWAERILANLRADESRRRARGARFVRLALPTVTTEADPEHQVLASERRRRVRQALLALPKAQRRVVLERFFAEGSQQPKSNTSRTRLHRALALLRTRLAGLASWLAPVGAWPREWASAPFGPAAGVLVLTLASAQTPALEGAGKYLAPSASHRAQVAPTRARRAAAPAATSEKHLAPSAPATSKKYLAPSAAAASKKYLAPSAAVPPSVRYDFEDDEVTGEVSAPERELVVGREGPRRHESLLEIPSSFATALVRSVDEQ